MILGFEQQLNALQKQPEDGSQSPESGEQSIEEIV